MKCKEMSGCVQGVTHINYPQVTGSRVFLSQTLVRRSKNLYVAYLPVITVVTNRCARQVCIRESVDTQEIANCLLLIESVDYIVVMRDPHAEKLADAAKVFDGQ